LSERGDRTEREQDELASVCAGVWERTEERSEWEQVNKTEGQHRWEQTQKGIWCVQNLFLLAQIKLFFAREYFLLKIELECFQKKYLSALRMRHNSNAKVKDSKLGRGQITSNLWTSDANIFNAEESRFMLFAYDV